MNSDFITEGKRITLKRQRPNPLFQGWLEELHDEAKAKKSKLEPMLKDALTSLSKYPLPVQTASECVILKGFNKKLCKFLDKRLEIYNSQSDSDSVHSAKTSSQKGDGDTQSIASITTTVLPSNILADSLKSGTVTTATSVTPQNEESTSYEKCAKQYRPRFRSGGYAILLALLENFNKNKDNPSLTKKELIDKAQIYSEESFIRPKPDTYYTAWSNMSLLITKGLVKASSRKNAKYTLTEQGTEVACSLRENESRPSVNDIIFNGVSTSNGKKNAIRDAETETSCNDLNPIVLNNGNLNIETHNDFEASSITVMNSGSFEVVLLIDKNETSGENNRNDPTVAQFNKFADLKHEYRSLKVGDFLWIARHKILKDQELVLPYVVERKRMDDLGASIKDGRFHEQKFRLRKCGLKNVIYLVENYGSNKYVGLPMMTLKQALANTRIQDGFKVQMTDSLTHSARFLAMMTKRLTIEFKDKSLRNNELQGQDLMTFNFFNKAAAKNKPLTVKETFIKLLLQIKGVSVEKAVAITKIYTTPGALREAYGNCGRKEGELLLAFLKYGESNKNVGPSISKSIYRFFVT